MPRKSSEKISPDEFVTNLKEALELERWRLARLLTLGLFILFVMAFVTSLFILVRAEIYGLAVHQSWRWIFGGSGLGLCGYAIRNSLTKKKG